MKRLLLLLVLVAMLAVPVAAHSGGTDAQGGHTDHSTGEYHYHHGYPAHQHKDMDGDGDKDCPYQFDDKTGWNSGTATGTGGSATKTVEVVKEVEVIKEVEVVKEVPYVPKWSKVLTAVLIVVTIIGGRFLYLALQQNSSLGNEAKELRSKIANKGKKISDLETQQWITMTLVEQKEQTIAEHDKTIRNLQAEIEAEQCDAVVRRMLCHDLLSKKLGRNYTLLLSDAPGHIELGEDGYPYSTNKKRDLRWGIECSYFVAGSTFNSGKGIYHRHNCPACNRKKHCPHELNFTEVIGKKHYTPCKVCIPRAELPKWQLEYMKVVEVFRVD